VTESSYLTPEQRALRARIGAYAALAKHGRAAMTEAARSANPSSDDYWRAKVDPDGQLSEQDRRTRAADAKRAYFYGLALKSAQKRQRSAERVQ
jgi:hypothetical protein